MSYLIDTNIVSELRKEERCNRNVARWRDGVDDDDLYVSVLVLGEIRRGIELLRARDPIRVQALERWLADFDIVYSDRILSLTPDIAEEWGRISALRTLPVIDALLAATAKVHGLILVSRNTKDFVGLNIAVFDPFAV